MDAAAALARANEAFAEENFAAALEMYSLAIELDNQQSGAFSNRAAIYLRNKQFTKALEDLNEAIRLDPAREIAYHRKGLACFELGEFETAKKAFEKGQELLRSQGDVPSAVEEARKYGMWIRKCEVEIENDDDEIAPLDQAASTTTAQAAAASAPASAPAPAPAAAAVPARDEEAKPTPPPVPRWNYYQSTDKVTITIFAKDLDPSDGKISIKHRHLKVVLRLDRKSKTDVVVLDTPLYARIRPDDARIRYLSTKVEIVLPKEEPIQWPTLEGEPDRTAVPAPTQPAGASVPRPYASRRDWDSIERELKQQEEEEKPEGDEALHKLFRDIYSRGTDETRRAMIKSFQTSGGTVLSTNWDEVSQKDYESERTAPNGMHWKDWEGNKLPQKDT